MMFWSTTFCYIGSRGQGKTYLSAIYCVARSILYPGSKIIIASGVRSQSIQVLEKIYQELKPLSPELCAEINEKESKINGTNALIVFKNTSVIKVVTASDNARGNRANVLLLDEFRLIDKNTIDTVLRKFLTQKRMPMYSALTEEDRKREYNKEKNLSMYLSSAYFKDHWSYIKCLDTWSAMTNSDRRQFICAFPYELPLSEGLLDRNDVEEEMLESNFSDIKWSINISVLFKPIEPSCLLGVPLFGGANRGTLSVIVIAYDNPVPRYITRKGAYVYNL